MRQSVKLWLEALESGKFAQTKGALENSEGNCCLGVACRVYEKEFPEKINIETGDDGRIFFNKEGAVLPDEVKNWIGLYSSSGKYAGGNLVLICEPCGIRYGKKRDCASSWHFGKCDYCKKRKISVTESRDFGYPKLPRKKKGR